jgi:polynucleotide 5'-kinase involved in rRNA processing
LDYLLILEVAEREKKAPVNIYITLKTYCYIYISKRLIIAIFLIGKIAKEKDTLMRYCQIVMGPAGSGKSTYCHVMQQHFEAIGRNLQIMNLDPAAEEIIYMPSIGSETS